MLCPTDLLHPTPYLHFKGLQSCDVLLSHSPYFCTVQGHTSNKCFHHSFLEAYSFFSILPLVILSSWKRLLSHCYPGVSILGAEGRDPPIFWGGGPGGGQGGGGGGRVVWGGGGREGGSQGAVGVVDESRNIIILSCTGSMFESGYF